MGAIRMLWAPKGGVLSPIWALADGVPAAGLFVPGPLSGPDCFVDLDPSPAGAWATVVLANGLVEDADPTKQRGVLQGEFALEVDHGAGWEPLTDLVPTTIGDGRGHVLRVGAIPGAELPAAYAAEVLRGYSAMADVGPLVAKLKACEVDAGPAPLNPDGAKEDRIVQATWAGSVLYALGLRRPEVLAAARQHVDLEVALRPCLYYSSKGVPVGYARDDVWVDERGLRKGYHGKWKRDAGYGIGVGGSLEDLEHLCPKRVHLLAAAGDSVARLYARFHAAAMLTRPGLYSPKLQQQSRAIGYQLEYLAHASMVGALQDEQAHHAAQDVLLGTLAGRGVGQWGVPYFGCWPVSTIHTTHVSLNEADPDGKDPHLSLEDAKGYLDWVGLDDLDLGSLDPFTMTTAEFLALLKKTEADSPGFEFGPGDLTTGPEGVQTLLNGVTVWGVAIAGKGMAACGRRWPTFDDHGLLQDAARLVIERGCGFGLDHDGKVIQAEQVFDSVAPRCLRVRQANVPNGGTSRWCVPGLVDMAERLEFLASDPQAQQKVLVKPGLPKLLRVAARRVFEHAPDLELSSEGVAAVEVAGLPALARFE